MNDFTLKQGNCTSHLCGSTRFEHSQYRRNPLRNSELQFRLILLVYLLLLHMLVNYPCNLCYNVLSLS